MTVASMTHIKHMITPTDFVISNEVQDRAANTSFLNIRDMSDMMSYGKVFAGVERSIEATPRSSLTIVPVKINCSLTTGEENMCMLKPCNNLFLHSINYILIKC